METQTFFLGAFIYPQKSPDPYRDVKPVMARIHAFSPHLAKRLLAWDLLRHGFFVKEIRVLTYYFSPFDEEEWEIPSFRPHRMHFPVASRDIRAEWGRRPELCPIAVLHYLNYPNYP